ELNLVQNVVEGQVLARKVPADEGTEGSTVTGKFLPAKPGSDARIDVGKNVRLSEDGRTAYAEINGQVVITGSKINVEPVYVVNGDVSLKTGNIMFLGTVLVKGSVEDGFDVKASGNIEVIGSVGKCNLDADGDIIVHQGINGKSSALVRAGGSIWSKFIENATAEAGDRVVVSDGIINAHVTAQRKVICRGKRASIVGGVVRAAEEIDAKSLGSVSGNETILEVGVDPKSKERLSELEEEKAGLTKQLEEVVLNMQTIEKLHKARKKLTQDKVKVYNEQKQKRAAITGDLRKVQREIDEVQGYLSELKTSGKISASSTVFSGVKINVRDATLNVKNEFKAVTFIWGAGVVKVTKYEESDEDITISRKG
ncbi:MAG: FapA family protein, partial [Spirochaeta sp.]|nr:FapA family protein [Spirochaeta sp.]